MGSPLDGLRRLAAASTGLLLTRAEFAALELAQARAQLMRWVVMALAVSLLALLGLIGLSAALVVAMWPQWGWATPVALAGVYLAAAAALAARLLRQIREAPPMLSQTLDELAKDRAALVAGAGADSQRPTP